MTLAEARRFAGFPSLRGSRYELRFDPSVPAPHRASAADEEVSEIMGNPNSTWWSEREGKLRQELSVSFDAGKLRTGLEVIANHLGKKLDEDNPLLNVQLPDGSRLSAYIPPVVRPAPGLTIRKFTSRRFTVDDLIARGALTQPLADFLEEQIRAGKTLLISGGTGTGKTTTLAVIRQAIETEGYRVAGFAPTSRAAKQLLEAGVEAGTLQGFLARSPQTHQHRGEKHFYFVDESSLASTRQMRDLLARLGPGDRVLLIGDIRQHQGVDAGRPFEQLQQAGMSTAKLDEIVRQKDPALKSVVEFLSKGRSVPAIDLLEQSGRIREIRDSGERIRTMAREYARHPTNTLIVSPDNASRRELNAAVRIELKAQGTLRSVEHRTPVLVQRSDMTGADRAWANHYAIGDVVRYTRGSKALGIDAGSYGTVQGVNPGANLLSVQIESGAPATYDPRRLTGVSVYRELIQEFAPGDRIQFTAPDKTLDVANRDLAVIDSIAPDGRIRAHLDQSRGQNRIIEFNPREYRHFDHGYAVTSHSSQGLTAERVLIHADTAIHPQLLSARFGYVAVSRASHEATIFTDDPKRLGERLATDTSKTSALDLGQTMVRGQSISV